MHKKLKIILIVLMCLLLLPINALAADYGKTGASTNFNGDVGVPSGSGYYINGVQITSDALSDVASIAMLDENETVTGTWEFLWDVSILALDDSLFPTITFQRGRDSDPNYDVASGDLEGAIRFDGRSGEVYYEGAKIQAIVDGTPGAGDMPSRLEFLTSTDGSGDPTLRMAIDNAGNIKMGDGAWTNYVNVSAGGALTFQGTANIKTVPFASLYDCGSSGAAPDIDWTNGNYQKITTDENMLFTFSNAFIGTITIVIYYGGDHTVGFNAGYAILEEGGTEIVFSGASGAVDILKVMYLGTANNYVVGAMLDVKD